MSEHLDGNLKGLKTSDKKALERTYRRRMTPDEVVSPELARHITRISRDLRRQVGVLIERGGTVRNVIVGNATQLTIPDVGRLRGGVGRFRGLRLVHTHLKGEPLSADDLNDLALLRLDLVAAIEVKEDGLPGKVELAHLAPPPPEALAEEGAAGSPDEALEIGHASADAFVHHYAPDVHRLDFDVDETLRALEDEYRRVIGDAARTDQERALVVGVNPDDAHFAETLELVRSAGVVVAGTLRQRRYKVHPKTVVGKGRLQDIVLEGMRRRAEVAIFDIDLKPAQARAFEDATGMKAIDRTQLILDVFAQRARSRDGKLQVELAQLKYSLPRLTDKDAGLSRLTGGIGGRGPGETQMEIGRRRIRDRIRALEKQTEQLSRQRDVQRSRRRREGVPVLSIVGYTNAGKSTLLNAMTRSEVAAADKLFMTLDPTSRRLRFPREGEVVITDTVGFIEDLPQDLVTAFRATLEELADADLLLHVVDAADTRLETKLQAVHDLLKTLELADLPQLLVFNKADLVAPERLAALLERHGGVAVSARTRQGINDLIALAEHRLNPQQPFLPNYGATPEPAPAEVAPPPPETVGSEG
jgi:GTPase